MDNPFISNSTQHTNYLQAANEPPFEFVVTNVDIKCKVLNFHSENHKINEDYCFTITVICDSTINHLLKPYHAATLTIWNNNAKHYIHGIITRYTCEEAYAMHALYYTFYLHSPMHPLKINSSPRVFVNKTLTMIINSVFQDNGLSNLHYKLLHLEHLPIIPLLLQYQENDFDFIVRQLKRLHLCFLFIQHENQAQLIIYDSTKLQDLHLPTRTLTYLEARGMHYKKNAFQEITAAWELGPSQLQFADHNTPESPDTYSLHSSLQGKSLDSSVLQRYGQTQSAITNSKMIFTAQQLALQAKQARVKITTNARGLMPGQVIELKEYYLADLNKEYIIVEITHAGNQSAGFAPFISSEDTPVDYEVNLQLIPKHLSFTEPYVNNPCAYGIYTAIIESIGGEYAYLDKVGSYHLRFPFDLESKPKGQASIPLRLAQSFVGHNFGQHLSIRHGTEVALYFQNGDFNLPIILGVLPNPETWSPVNASEPYLHRLRTYGDNTIQMSDLKDNERIDIMTHHAQNVFSLYAHRSKHQILIESTVGKINLSAHKSCFITVGADTINEVARNQEINIQDKRLLQVLDNSFFAHANSFCFSAQDNFYIKTKHNTRMKINKNFYWQAQNFLCCTIQAGATIKAHKKNIAIKAHKNLKMQAMGNSNVLLKSKDTKWVISSLGHVSIKIKTLKITAPFINLHLPQDSSQT